MVADQEGAFMSQRQNPKLALVMPQLTDEQLVITAPGMEMLAVDLGDTSYARVPATVWGNEAPAIAQGFADGASMLLTSESSLAALNERLAQPVPMSRFRPNIVVAGEDVPAFDEDYWRHVKIGELSGVVGWACARCIVTEIDQETAVRGKQVLKALQGFRKGADAVNPSNKGVFFGQNLLHHFVEGTTVRVGDRLEVVERSGERNILGLV